MKKAKFYKILNIISIFIYLLATIFTSFLLIRYSIGEKTEGSGIVIMVAIFVNAIECFIVILINGLGIAIMSFNKDKVSFDDNLKLKFKKQIVSMQIMIIVPISTFIIQMILFDLIN